MKSLLAMAAIAFSLAIDSQDKPVEIPNVLLDSNGPEWKEKPPEEFLVKFETSTEDHVVLVERAWSPLGAAGFHGVVSTKLFDAVRFFLIVPKFMAQFGIHASPKVSAASRSAKVDDEGLSQPPPCSWKRQ